jgi:hypothetical protein
MSPISSRATRAYVLAFVVACGAVLGAEAALSKQDALRFQSKMEQIERYAATPRRTALRSVQISDSEVNAYLKYLAGSQVPVGIVDPILTARGNGRVAGRAIVDLDAVRTQKKRQWSDPLAYLTGKLPVTASGVLTTNNGIGRFQLESAEISGITVPKTLIQELLSYYSRTPEKPNGINMDDPFHLPSAIREIRVGQGTALIVQ